MKHTATYAVYTISLLLVLVSALSGQGPAIGTPPFGGFGGGPFDVINLGNLNVHFTIPILHKAGRGTPFAYDLTYDSSLWYPGSVNGTQTWQPVAGYYGWQGLTGTTYTKTSYSTLYTSGNCGQYGQNTWQSWQYGHLAYTDQTGNHPFPYGSSFIQTNGTTNCPPPGPNPSTPFLATASDNSGLTAYVLPPTAGSISATFNNPSGTIFTPGGSYGSTDANGNQITSSGGVYKDTLGQTALTVAGVPPSNTTFAYTAPSGATPSYVVSYKSYTVKTNFHCNNISEYNTAAIYLVDKITLPDGTFYQFQYEVTAGGTSGQVTGRLAKVNLPTGGSITYQYAMNGIYNGINCTDGSAPVANPSITRTVTPGGQWLYARSGSGTSWGTTVTDPSSNQTLINFSEDASLSSNNFYETWRNVYQGSSGSGTSLMIFDNCWNANFSNCATQAVYAPISRQDAYIFLPNGSSNVSEASYNSYGLVTDKRLYDWGQILTQDTAIAYATLGNGIVDHPSSVKVMDGNSNLLAETTYGYDGATLQTTPSTPQHLPVTGYRGNVTTITNYTTSSGGISKQFTYYDTGNVYQATDVNGAVTTYVYGTTAQGNSTVSCGNSFPTQVNQPLSLSTSTTWNCIGGVATKATDANGNSTTTTYQNDPDFWRPDSVTDPANNTTTFTYTGQNQIESSMPNSSGSVTDQVTTLDGFGRTIFAQTKQGPTISVYDTVGTCYDALGRVSLTSLPYSAAKAITTTACPSEPGISTTYDALSRPISVSDSGGGTVGYTYSNNDVYQTLGPQPTGENTKRKQFEYDGLGRLTSVCEVTSGTTSWPGGNCAQKNPQTGYWTEYGYDAVGDLTSVTQNAQGSPTQTRTYVYDMLGRLTSEKNPETKNLAMTYAYDAVPSACYNFGDNQAGNMTGKTDANGNTSCYHRDALHRLADVAYSGPNSTPCGRFRYDITTNGVNGSAPSGVTVGNIKGQLMEAETDNCGTWPPTPITDDWFGYSPRGEVTNSYSSTPHSGGYKHLAETFWPNGAVNNIAVPGMPALYYGASDASGLDGEGRVTKVTASAGSNPVIGATYLTSGSPAGALTQVVYGSGDTDNFTFYSTTGRMQQYQLNMGTKSDTGTLTWNGNGSLGTLGIVDQIGDNTQTCNFSHDDLSRIASANCGSAWSQTFTSDPFGNVTKSGSMAWTPNYDANNRYTLSGTSYDANGDLLTDTFHSYTWDANGNLATVGSTTVTYDALGRMVENGTSSYTQYLYLGDGQTQFAAITGSSTLGFAPMPGGAFAIFSGGSIAEYNHPDWLGSARLITSPSQTMVEDTSFAPFGEAYGGNPGGWLQFTEFGRQNTVQGPNDSGLNDYLFRRYSSTQSRWISPDPAGMAAVDPTNPQTWNRYAYVMNNPLSWVDPLGLCYYGQIQGGFPEDQNNYTLGSSSQACPEPPPGCMTLVNEQGMYLGAICDITSQAEPQPAYSGGNPGASAANVGVIRSMTSLECTASRAEGMSLASQANIQNNTMVAKFTNMALGNTFSGLYNFAQTVATATNAAPVYGGLVLNGVRQGLPGGGTMSKGVTGVVQDALLKAAAQNLEQVSAQEAADSVGGVKLLYDAATFVYAGVQCIY